MNDDRVRVVIPCLFTAVIGFTFFNLLAWGVLRESKLLRANGVEAPRENALTRADQHVAASVHEYREENAGFDPCFNGLTRLGEGEVLFGLTGVVFLVLLWRRRLVLAVLGPVAALGAGVVNEWIKDFFQRPRQMFATSKSFSFPSGHSMRAFVCFGLLAYVLVGILPRRSWRWSAVLTLGAAALAVSVSRVYLNQHYCSDVLGSISFGAGWLALWIGAWEWTGAGFTKNPSRAPHAEV